MEVDTMEFVDVPLGMQVVKYVIHAALMNRMVQNFIYVIGLMIVQILEIIYLQEQRS